MVLRPKIWSKKIADISPMCSASVAKLKVFLPCHFSARFSVSSVIAYSAIRYAHCSKCFPARFIIVYVTRWHVNATRVLLLWCSICFIAGDQIMKNFSRLTPETPVDKSKISDFKETTLPAQLKVLIEKYIPDYLGGFRLSVIIDFWTNPSDVTSSLVQINARYCRSDPQNSRNTHFFNYFIFQS